MRIFNHSIMVQYGKLQKSSFLEKKFLLTTNKRIVLIWCLFAKQSLELHGELKPTSESIIEEDKVNKIEAQPEQSDIASEDIINDQESKLEHMTEKDLEDGKRYMEEDLTLAPENQIKSIENHNEITKNVILTDEVSQQ